MIVKCLKYLILAILVLVTAYPSFNFCYNVYNQKPFKNEKQFIFLLIHLVIGLTALSYILCKYSLDIYLMKAQSLIPLFITIHLFVWLGLFTVAILGLAASSCLDKKIHYNKLKIKENELISKIIQMYKMYIDKLAVNNRKNTKIYDIKFLKNAAIITYFIAGVFVASSFSNLTLNYIFNKSKIDYDVIKDMWDRDLTIYSNFFIASLFTIFLGRILKKGK